MPIIFSFIKNLILTVNKLDLFIYIPSYLIDVSLRGSYYTVLRFQHLTINENKCVTKESFIAISLVFPFFLIPLNCNPYLSRDGIINGLRKQGPSHDLVCLLSEGKD